MNKRWLFALQEDKAALLGGLRALEAAGLAGVEAFSPYPDEDIEHLVVKRRSPLLGMVLAMAVVGVLVALAFQYWTTGIDYRTVVGGKSPTAIHAYIPVMFEVMVLFATVTASLGMLLALNRLPLFGHPLHKTSFAGKVTKDSFAVAVEVDGKNEETAMKLLQEAGFRRIELVEEEIPVLKAEDVVRGLAGIAVAAALAGTAVHLAIKLMPILPPVSHMHRQPKVNPYRDMRLPPAESVFKGMVLSEPDEKGLARLASPAALDGETLAAGKEKFRTFCAPCHGAAGDGSHFLGPNYQAKPQNLLSSTMIGRTDGELYHAITSGRNSMPGYGKDLSPGERWAVVAYLRVLQRSRNATEADYQEATGGAR